MATGRIVNKRGRLYAVIDEYPNGKRKQKWVALGTSNSKKAAVPFGRIMADVDRGIFVKPGKLTLAAFLDQWLETVRPNLAPKTAQWYADLIRRYIGPALGAERLTSLSPQAIQKLYASLTAKGLLTSGHGVHSTLHRAFSCAIKWGLLARNPCDATTSPRQPRRQMKIWDAAELDSFLEGAKDTPYYAPLHLLAFTGMRRSEVCGLQWADLDLVGGNVHVSRTLSAEGGKVSFRDTKTAASRRTVSLPPSAAVVLRTHRANCEAMAAGFRRTIDARELVFASADGRPLLPDTLTHVFEQLVKNTGVTPVRLHDLRHLHASLLLSSGVHPKVVQSRLGHASITTTLNVYSHVTPGLEEAAAKRFDEAVKVVSGRTQVGAR